MFDWNEHAWPVHRVLQAVQALGRRAGLTEGGLQLAALARDDGGAPPGDEALGLLVREAALALGMELLSSEVVHADLGAPLAAAAPCLVRVDSPLGPRLVALVRRDRSGVELLGPDERLRRISLAALRQICEPVEAAARHRAGRALEPLELSGRAQARAAEFLARDQLAGEAVGACWSLRMPPQAGVWRQLRRSGLARLLAWLVAAEIAGGLLGMAGWWIVGRGALTGHFERGELLLWALLGATAVPLAASSRWWRGCFATGFGALLRRRLLRGIHHLDPDEMRIGGAGRALAQVLEAQAFERTMLDVALSSLSALTQVGFAFGVLSLGAAGALHLPLFFSWLALLLGLAWIYHRFRARWTEQRLATTRELTEQMVGHRTRVAQLPPQAWHEAEDELLADYLERSAAMDRVAVRFRSIVASGWLPVGLLGLFPGFVTGSPAAGALAVSVGGVLLAHQALQSVAYSLEQAIQALISWRHVAPIYRAAARSQPVAAPEAIARLAGKAPDASRRSTVLEVQGLTFRHGRRLDPTLVDCDLTVAEGDRILLEGPSGGGKSTLSALLSGLRPAHSGIILLRGVDLKTLGLNAWRRSVVLAPQFQENFVFSGTLAFNLLIGRRWPPEPDDIRAAYDLCCELGLEDLLSRMPLGLDQMVGEQGWQLSHGERSRVFLARALLQDPDLLILDETLGALDPETARRALACVVRRARALLLIGHP